MAEATQNELAWQRGLSRAQRGEGSEAAEAGSDQSLGELSEEEQSQAGRENNRVVRTSRLSRAPQQAATTGVGRGLQAAGRVGMRAGVAMSGSAAGSVVGAPLTAASGAAAAVGTGMVAAQGASRGGIMSRLRRGVQQSTGQAAGSALETGEETIQTAKRLQNIYRLVNGLSALSIVGLIVTFFVMNFQLIAGNLFHAPAVPSLSKIEVGLLLILDLLFAFLLLILVMFLTFLASPDLYVDVFLNEFDNTTLGKVILFLVPDALLKGLITRFPDILL